MPLKKGKAKETVNHNIKTLTSEGYDAPGQAVAIALKTARLSKTDNNKKKSKLYETMGTNP